MWKPDRLGRRVKVLLDFAGGLNERRIGFVSLTDAIDTTTVSGRFFFNTMTSLAQMGRELLAERTQACLQAAREQGQSGGRKRTMTETKIRSARKLLNQGTPPREIADTLSVSVPPSTDGSQPQDSLRTRRDSRCYLVQTTSENYG